MGMISETESKWKSKSLIVILLIKFIGLKCENKGICM